MGHNFRIYFIFLLPFVSCEDDLWDMHPDNITVMALDNFNNISALIDTIELETEQSVSQVAEEIFDDYYRINVSPEIERVVSEMEKISDYEKSLVEYEVSSYYFNFPVFNL